MSRIPIANPLIGDEEKARVLDVLDGGQLADGPEVREFEQELAEYCGAEGAVAVSNGTAALHAACEALGLGADDVVLTTPFSFVASANAVRLCGAKPIFADVDPLTHNLDPEAVRKEIERRDGDVDAILAVHLYGLSAALDELRAIADEFDCYLIEDCAQAHGATHEGRHVGTVGEVGCFSFYPTKNATTGEGGAVLSDDPEVLERAARFINHGRTDTYEHAAVGHNLRMTSLSAAIGRQQLTRLPTFVATRRANARTLTRMLADVRGVTTPVEPDGRRHAYNQYTIRYPDRDGLIEYLDERGIGTGVYYPRPIHEQPAYDAWTTDAPVSERAADEVVSLPVHPALSDEEIRTVAEAVADYIDSKPTTISGGGFDE